MIHRGRDLLKLSPREMRAVRGGEIAMIFQDPMTALTPVYTVGWQIAEQLRAHEELTKRQARARTIELLAEVGISNPERRIDDYPHQFSGGMRQRVMIAMALSCNPSLLIADEPTTALDVTIQAQILELMKRLQRDYGSVDPPDHPRHGRRLRDRRAGGRDVRGQRRRGRAESRGLPRPAAPVHLGPARIDSRASARAYAGSRRSPDCRRRRSRRPRAAGSRRAAAHRFERCSIRPELAERVAPGRADACHLDPAVRPLLRAGSAA